MYRAMPSMKSAFIGSRRALPSRTRRAPPIVTVSRTMRLIKSLGFSSAKMLDGHARQMREDILPQAVGADFHDLLSQVVLEVLGDAPNDGGDPGDQHDEKHGFDRVLGRLLAGQYGDDPLGAADGSHSHLPPETLEPFPRERRGGLRIVGRRHLHADGLERVTLRPLQHDRDRTLSDGCQFLQQPHVGDVRIPGPQIVDIGDVVQRTNAGLLRQTAFRHRRHPQMRVQGRPRSLRQFHRGGNVELQPIVALGGLAIHPAVQTLGADHDLQQRDDRREAQGQHHRNGNGAEHDDNDSRPLRPDIPEHLCKGLHRGMFLQPTILDSAPLLRAGRARRLRRQDPKRDDRVGEPTNSRASNP